jgi:hypothetical protein
LRIVSLLVALAVSAMYAAVPGGLPAGADGGAAVRADGGDPALLARVGRLDSRLARHDGRGTPPTPFAPPLALLAGALFAPPALDRAAVPEIAGRRPGSAAFEQPKTCRGPPAASPAV